MPRARERYAGRVHKIGHSRAVILNPKVLKSLSTGDLRVLEQEALPDGSGILMKLPRVTV